jgi:hypothetical protein
MWSHLVGWTGTNVMENIAAPILTAYNGGSRFSV